MNIYFDLKIVKFYHKKSLFFLNYDSLFFSYEIKFLIIETIAQ